MGGMRAHSSSSLSLRMLTQPSTPSASRTCMRLSDLEDIDRTSTLELAGRSLMRLLCNSSVSRMMTLPIDSRVIPGRKVAPSSPRDSGCTCLFNHSSRAHLVRPLLEVGSVSAGGPGPAAESWFRLRSLHPGSRSTFSFETGGNCSPESFFIPRSCTI